MAACALTQLQILNVVEVVQIEVVFELSTLVALEGHLLQLAIHLTSLGNDTSHVHQLVHVNKSQGSNVVVDGDILDLDEDLGVDLLEGWVVSACHLVCCHVQIWEDN